MNKKIAGLLVLVISLLNIFCDNSPNPSSSNEKEYVKESIIYADLKYEPKSENTVMEKILEISIAAISDPVPDIRKVTMNGNILSNVVQGPRDMPASYFSVQIHVDSFSLDLSSPVTLTVETDMGTASGSIMIPPKSDSIISYSDGDTVASEQDLVMVKTSNFDHFRIFYSRYVSGHNYTEGYSYSKNSDTLIIPADSFYLENVNDSIDELELQIGFWNGSFPEFGEEANMTGTASGFLVSYCNSYLSRTSMSLYLNRP